jgi:hypothetical protein
MTSAGPLEAIVFIDAQNVYLTAREAFGWEDESSRRGNFNPLALGQLLTKGPGVELKQVRVYTGAPSQQRDDQGYRAARKRFDTWKYEGGGKVIVRERNLSTAPGRNPARRAWTCCSRSSLFVSQEPACSISGSSCRLTTTSFRRSSWSATSSARRPCNQSAFRPNGVTSLLLLSGQCHR